MKSIIVYVVICILSLVLAYALFARMLLAYVFLFLNIGFAFGLLMLLHLLLPLLVIFITYSLLSSVRNININTKKLIYKSTFALLIILVFSAIAVLFSGQGYLLQSERNIVCRWINRSLMLTNCMPTEFADAITKPNDRQYITHNDAKQPFKPVAFIDDAATILQEAIQTTVAGNKAQKGNGTFRIDNIRKLCGDSLNIKDVVAYATPEDVSWNSSISFRIGASTRVESYPTLRAKIGGFRTPIGIYIVEGELEMPCTYPRRSSYNSFENETGILISFPIEVIFYSLDNQAEAKRVIHRLKQYGEARIGGCFFIIVLVGALPYFLLVFFVYVHYGSKMLFWE